MRGIDTLLIELCASDHSELMRQVPYGSAAIRITQQDLTNTQTMRAITSMIQIARRNDIKVLVWTSTPCTAGFSWRHINIAKGHKTGDKVLTNKLIKNAVKICRLAKALGRHYVWELPGTLDLWHDRRVRALTFSPCDFAIISASAFGWTTVVRNE